MPNRHSVTTSQLIILININQGQGSIELSNIGIINVIESTGKAPKDLPVEKRLPEVKNDLKKA